MQILVFFLQMKVIFRSYKGQCLLGIQMQPKELGKRTRAGSQIFDQKSNEQESNRSSYPIRESKFINGSFWLLDSTITQKPYNPLGMTRMSSMPDIPEGQQKSYLPSISTNTPQNQYQYIQQPLKPLRTGFEQFQDTLRSPVPVIQTQNRGFETGLNLKPSPPQITNYSNIRFSSEPVGNQPVFNANVPKFNQGSFHVYHPPDISQKFIEDQFKMSNRIRITKYKNWGRKFYVNFSFDITFYSVLKPFCVWTKFYKQTQRITQLYSLLFTLVGIWTEYL